MKVLTSLALALMFTCPLKLQAVYFLASVAVGANLFLDPLEGSEMKVLPLTLIFLAWLATLLLPPSC